MEDRHILFTNIRYVIVNGVRTETHALLLTEGKYLFGPSDRKRLQLRGFGTDPAWPVFDLDVSSMEYELVDARSSAVMITDDAPEGRPLFQGGVMRIKNGPEIQIVTSSHAHTLRIERFEGCITKVWAVLPARVREFWDAPNMPELRWVSVRR